ncbi:hypothetical protein CHS0354_015372 [Potamilus streckersoni]|uniref:Uncharacterized protein n=1 Tax=Potamilus streckersoni TaxID=2493646 RepID=A0AAE0S0W8_9BIVA|nr:hypothetical protein CHS0354_015372 [Potamilus streckersoni]
MITIEAPLASRGRKTAKRRKETLSANYYWISKEPRANLFLAQDYKKNRDNVLKDLLFHISTKWYDRSFFFPQRGYELGVEREKKTGTKMKRCLQLRLQIVSYLIILSAGFLRAQFSYTNFLTSMSTFLGSYGSVDLIPIMDFTETKTVFMDMHLYSISDFDAVTGQIKMAGALELSWVDESVNDSLAITNTPATFMCLSKHIWTPDIVLLNAVDTTSKIGDSSSVIRFTYPDMTVRWKQRIIIKAACNPDVTYYPFDQQTCTLIFTPWNYDNTEIQLSFNSSEWQTDDYDANGVWSVVETKTETAEIESLSVNKYTITIRRQSLYYALNIIFPILLLSIVTGFVFLIPADAEERMGYSSTCFLSFMVLLQMLMSFLPQTSSPMSTLCVYIILMMMFSSFSTIATCLMLRVHLKPAESKVPKPLVIFMRVIKCSICKKRCKSCAKRSNIVDIQIEKKNNSNKVANEEHDIDWRSVGKMLDFFFFLIFLGLQAALTVFFLIPLGTRYL